MLIFLMVVFPVCMYLRPSFATWRFYSGCFFIGYLSAQILAFAFQRATGFRRPTRACLLMGAGVAVGAYLAAFGFSKFYWGYFFFRPPPLKELASIAAPPAIIPIATYDGTNALPHFVVRQDESLADSLRVGARNPYDWPGARLLLALGKHGLLPPAFSTSAENLPPLSTVTNCGFIVPADPGYDGDRLLGGYAVDAVAPTGQRLMFVALQGAQIQNDHYPYYELLFTIPAGSSDWEFVRGQRFFFDVAGIEGAEWYFLGIAFTLMGMPPAFVALIAIMGVVRGIARIRKRKWADIHPPGSPA